MPQQKPVIFLAFANAERDLSALAGERLALEKACEIAEQKGLVKLAARADATHEDIRKVFQRNRNKVAVFHFAGHSSALELLLVSSEFGSEGLQADLPAF